MEFTVEETKVLIKALKKFSKTSVLVSEEKIADSLVEWFEDYLSSK